jgi:hypothetical protein
MGGRRLPSPLADRLRSGPHSYRRNGRVLAKSLMERTGIEPVTSGLQSRRSPS